MAQEIINVGATADDGTGDDLRVGFIKTNTNFDQIWAAGPVGSNITVLNNTVSVTNTNGNLILSPNGVGIIQTNRHLYPRLDNTYELGSANLRYRSLFVGSGGITNSGNLTLGNISNLKIPGGQNGYIIQTDGAANLSWVAMPGAGNGSPGGSTGQIQFNDGGLFGGSGNLTFNKINGAMTVVTVNCQAVFANTFSASGWSINGNRLQLPSGGSWVSDVNTLDDYISSAVDGFLNLQTFDSTSNLAAQFHLEHGLAHINILNGSSYQWEFNDTGLFSAPGNIEANGNITANYFLGDGSELINLPGGVIQGNIPPVSPNDTTLWWDDVTGRLYVWYDDGTGLQWVDAAPAGPAVTYGNSNVASFLASGNNSANIVTTGGVVAVSVETNTITSGDSTLVVVNDGLQVVGDIIPDTSNVYSLGSSTNQWNDLYVSNATIFMNNVPISLSAGNVLTVNGNAVLTNNSNTTVSTTGNVTANYFFGNGSQLTGLPAPTVTQDVSSTGAMSLMTYDGTIKYVSYATVEPASGNLTAGNISATGNITGNYIFGNGSQLTGITANTGNVTFSNQIVLGTGTNDGSGGLYLAPGTDSIANSAVQYLRVRGGDYPTHIHLDTGNNAYYDQYFGADTKYVKLEANGNIVINADDGANSATWTFDNTGNLTLPGNTIAINYANGNLAFGTVTFNNEAVIGTGTSNTVSGLYLAPDPVSLANDLYLRVRGNIQDEPTHIHFDTGNNAYYNQFIGDDNKYIQLANTGNIVINTSDYVGNTAQWTFDTDGNLTFPTGNLVITPDDPAGNIAFITSTDHPLGILSTGANGAVSSLWIEDIGNVGTSNIAAVYANPTPGSGIVRIAVGQNGSPGPNLWDFDTTGNLTAPGNISATGNITGAYLFGNGSQLTGITASVPSQTILPTIQTITVVARPAGLFGGGQGGANVTVANTIPVTEYGVIITDGTTSEKYKTGSLGSIPGTVSLTFTTGLNSTQFTVFAYVTSNAGTFYSNSATGTSGICLLAGTQIALSDGTHKAIEHITYTDKMLSWDFDRGCYAETTAMWIKRGETGSQYNLLTFSDGTTLRTFDQHRIFNKQAGAFTYPMTDATPVGTITVNEHGQEIILTNKQVIVDTIEYYNVITYYHMNLFSDTVLTSCRFNNIYPITDMKFVKDGRTLRTRDEFENVEDRFFHGLRLAEQTTDIETVEWYVNRLISTEVSTQLELTF
jgi:hypothetical protein